MPDISLRLNKDMLVLSSPVESALARLGVDTARDVELVTLLETENVEDVLRMEVAVGAQCVVAPTAGITSARLAHTGFQDRAEQVATAALGAARTVQPQHLLVEIGPCGLPLDRASKASLNENRAQYTDAARLFANEEFDAFFLNSFTNCDDLQCALMGVRQVSDAPLFASVNVGADGVLASGRGTIENAAEIMAEYGATVAGFATAATAGEATTLAKRAASACDLPLLAQLEVCERNDKQGGATPENPYFCADTMVEAAVQLRAAGVQFLRAVGEATPAYTGALAVAVMGFDAVLSDDYAKKNTNVAKTETAEEEAPTEVVSAPSIDFNSPEMIDLIAAARAEISNAIKGGA